MATFISHSPAETEALGEAWGREAQPGLAIALTGDLGSGKTVLVRGLARGLGITARIQSPTFALVNIHETGRLPLFHLDLYRLDTPEQISAAGLEDYLRTEGVTVIEWAERWFDSPRFTVHSCQSKVQSPKPKVGGRGGSVEGEEPEEVRFPPDHASRITHHGSRIRVHAPLRWVRFETVGQSERRITYEDIGA